MSDSAAFDFHVAVMRTTTPAASADLFRAAVAPFGFDTFACGELDLKDRHRTAFYLIDWPDDWRRFYLSSGLIDRDPLLDALAVSRNPFTWTDLRRQRKLDKLGRGVLAAAAAHGWTEGLVVPMACGAGRVGLVSLVGHQAPVPPEARAFLTLASVSLHHHVRSLVATHGCAAPPAGLTERELACIRLVAKGHSDAAIAKALKVAPSTAHEFVEKSKRKLKVRSRVELIAVLVSLGVLDL